MRRLVLAFLVLIGVGVAKVWPALENALEINREAARIIRTYPSLLLLPLASLALSSAVVGWFGYVLTYTLTPQPQRVQSTLAATASRRCER